MLFASFQPSQLLVSHKPTVETIRVTAKNRREKLFLNNFNISFKICWRISRSLLKYSLKQAHMYILCLYITYVCTLKVIHCINIYKGTLSIRNVSSFMNSSLVRFLFYLTSFLLLVCFALLCPAYSHEYLRHYKLPHALKQLRATGDIYTFIHIQIQSVTPFAFPEPTAASLAL